MRTTIVLDNAFEKRIKPFISTRKLSEFINRCIREHFEHEEARKRERELEKAYERAAKENIRDFEGLDGEDWPEW